MFDLSTGPYLLYERSASVVFDFLRTTLPINSKVTFQSRAKSPVILVRDGFDGDATEIKKMMHARAPVIVVSEGLWRGASLIFSSDESQLALVGIVYKIAMTGRFVVLIGTCVALSIIFTLLASAIAGQFMPVGSLGGIAGFGISGKIGNSIVRSLGSSAWSADLKQAIERVKTRQTHVSGAATS